MSTYTMIYAAWLYNESEDFIHNLYLCNRLFGIGGSLTGTALPYWQENFKPISDDAQVDAVTGATQKNQDFSITMDFDEIDLPRKFWIYFECDYSYNINAWFGDQPSLTYGVEIDLDNLQNSYTLAPLGWTSFEYCYPNWISSAVQGELQTEMRYITNTKNGDTFGDAYTDYTPATNMVKTLIATVTK